MRRLSLLALTVALVLGVAQTRADVSYHYVTDQSNYSASANGTVTVDVFLQEVLTGSSTSIIKDDGSLYGIGFLVSTSGSTGGATINVNSLKFNTNDPTSGTPPGFTNQGNSSVLPNSPTQIGGLVNTGNGSIGPNPTDISSVNGTALASTITNSVLLGQFTINAGTAASTSFTLQAYNHYSGVYGNTITQQGTDLDQAGTNTAPDGQTYTGADTFPAYTFTVTTAAVPEPNGLMLSGLIGLPAAGLGVWMRRRKMMIAQA